MGVVLVVLARRLHSDLPRIVGRVSALNATCAWPDAFAWLRVRESAIVSTIRAVSALVCLTKCVLAPQLHRAPACVYACVYRTRLRKRPRPQPLPSADLEQAGRGVA